MTSCADGYRVELIDVVPLHVKRAARLAGVTAWQGDARELPLPDESVDAVLLLGPLYHLAERADRVRTLAEVVRVVRPSGLVAAATISRYLAVHDTIYLRSYLLEEQRKMADSAAVDGVILSSNSGFTAYCHDPDEVPVEFADASLPEAARYGLEGPFSLYGDINDWLDDPDRRALMRDAQRRLESVPS
ncbi:class I SAM-dependent methyltransferase [Streptosporangium sp. NPDC002544]|uniref:class I SAM-dependent methyltransferase n=1 Tax=Streptosporangium sp. NPDC002544 TaxID=3154538 RepID=UPI0033297457